MDLIFLNDLYTCFNNRRSRRNYKDTPITLEELSFLLWSTQGVQKVIPAYKNTGHITLRPVPSAGGRHSSETYLAVNNVAGLDKGIYIYMPLEHKLALCHYVDNLTDKLIYAYGGEGYYCEAHRLMLLDIGHICQNLYLACEGVGCGTCAIAGYVQEAFDELLGLDGKNEYVVYLAAVGKVK